MVVYRDRQKFLKNWKPSAIDQEKIRLAVQFSADNQDRNEGNITFGVESVNLKHV